MQSRMWLAAGSASLALLCGDSMGAEIEGGFVRLDPGDEWRNPGVLDVLGSYRIHSYRGSIVQTGTVNVRAGEMALLNIGGNFTSTGTWTTAPGATLSLEGGWGTAPWLPVDTPFEGGALINAGTLRFVGANMHARLSPSVPLTGPGWVEVLEGGGVVLGNHVDIGGLRIGPAFAVDCGFTCYMTNTVVAPAGLTTGALHWGDGTLAANGRVTVNGRATLTEDLSKTAMNCCDYLPLGKRIDAPFHFNGGVAWDAHSDITGSGSVHVAAGTTFHESNSIGVQAAWRPPRPTRIMVASFDNAGTYLKTGAGETVITSAFRNTGTLRAQDAGTLTLAGTIDNPGTIEAVRSRIVLWGPLAQFDGRRLTGGRYVVRDGQLVMNLGTDAAGTAPARVYENNADIVLDGPRARLATTWLGTEDANALSDLSLNQGRLSLLNGATMQVALLLNDGMVDIAGRSRLTLGRAGLEPSEVVYGQYQDNASTYIDGTLTAPRMLFMAGSFGAGSADGIGWADLVGQEVTFGAAVFDVDVFDLQHHDLVTTSANAMLGGTLDISFADGVTPGTLRILQAEGGIGGQFAQVTSNLDPSTYRVSAVYGSHSVDLTISAVPEPSAVALFAGGVALLLARRRRTSHEAARPQ